MKSRSIQPKFNVHWAKIVTLPTDLKSLEAALRDLSHDDSAVRLVRDFASQLGKTKQRQQIFNASGAIVRDPLDYDEALATGSIEPTEDRFSLLQGDIISSDAAYLLGERLTGMNFVIASSTCDLVPGRREYAALLRIQPITANTPNAADAIGQLLKFQSTQRLYLPPLPSYSIRFRRRYATAMINPPIQVFGYHGTSREKANTILSEGFRVSDNDYDWLGEGVYFFQDAPYRAMQWATQQHPQQPGVIRAVIQLDNCIDLLDIKWIPPLKIVYNSFREGYQRFVRAASALRNLPLPQQNPTLSKAHRLDCAFFNYTTELLRRQGQNMETIRVVFVEGESIFPSSAIFDLAHIQIAVKNTALIKDCQLTEYRWRDLNNVRF